MAEGQEGGAPGMDRDTAFYTKLADLLRHVYGGGYPFRREDGVEFTAQVKLEGVGPWYDVALTVRPLGAAATLEPGPGEVVFDYARLVRLPAQEVMAPVVRVHLTPGD